jgi:SAM-dependent methyltransferase
MRAAVKLMGLDVPLADGATPSVVADLGCGDGEFLIGMLTHLNSLSSPATAITGVGIDYSPSLIATASSNAVLASQSLEWLTYDFNLDEADLVAQLQALGVTHTFVYLVPKQLALKTVRNILVKLWESGVVVCCHKFQPEYLKAKRSDVIMDLAAYEQVTDHLL